MRLDKLLDERIRKRFPFSLTGAQQNAVWEIARDLQSGHSGKMHADNAETDHDAADFARHAGSPAGGELKTGNRREADRNQQ